MATGVLVVGVNRATRLLGHLSLTDKAYEATIRLGSATTTDDAEGEVVSRSSAAGLTDAAIESELVRPPWADQLRFRRRSQRSRSTECGPTPGSAAARR